MSLFSSIGKAFKKVGKVLKQAWDLAKDAGIDDDLLNFALKYIRIADSKYVDNAPRREWVVKKLMYSNVPESVARLTVEMAYQIYRKEKAKRGI